MFSRTTEYALRAAVFLSEVPDQKHTSQQIAETTQVPIRYMSKVLQLLVEAGVADSQRGPTGGFWLSRPPEKISLLDIVSAIEPIQRIEGCPLGLAAHADELCPLHKELDELARIAEDRLRATSLRDVMSQRIVPLGIKTFAKASEPPSE